MRRLKIDENVLRQEIRNIINHNILGIDIKSLNRELKNRGFNVSPQVIRRNIKTLFEEKRLKFNQKHGKKNSN